jgi:hypothetical protein
MKWAYLENLSPAVSITLLPWTFGKPSMKSRERYLPKFVMEPGGVEVIRLAAEFQSCYAGKLNMLVQNHE